MSAEQGYQEGYEAGNAAGQADAGTWSLADLPVKVCPACKQPTTYVCTFSGGYDECGLHGRVAIDPRN